jgi:hypothetical protein
MFVPKQPFQHTVQQGEFTTRPNMSNLLNWWGDSMLEAVRSLTHVLLIDNYPVADTNTIASLLSEPNHDL